MIKTKHWQDLEQESSIRMNTEDWMADEIDSLRDELLVAYNQRAELLEALKASARLREIDQWLGAIERTRRKGRTGIAVDDDECAKEWQKLRKECDPLLMLIDAAITRAAAQIQLDKEKQ